MWCRVERSELSGRTSCPPSKSYTHRAVFAAALAGGGRVRGPLHSADTRASVEACRAMGASVESDGDVRVCSPVDHSRGPARIDAGNSGTTVRIAAAVAALSGSATRLTGDASLRSRPVGPLLEALGSLGASCESDSGRPPFSVRGPLRPGTVDVPGDVSSQFVTSLLMCAPPAGGITVRAPGLVSRPYVEATVEVMRRFGTEASADGDVYRASGRYAPADFEVPSDYSAMALALAAAALCGGATVEARDGGLPQGDSAFLGMLEGMGARVRSDSSSVTVESPGRLSGGHFDLSGSPDLLPPLAALSVGCSGPIRITGVAHARHKETDRISLICSELAKAGVRTRELPDGAVLDGSGQLRGADLDPRGDHRLFMAFCAAGMRVGGFRVADPESAAVSWPGFVGQMRGLGARIELPGAPSDGF